MRLDKLIEQELKTSRKATKQLLLTGQVCVDGQVTRQANKNVDSQIHMIQVAEKKLVTTESYFLMNKPQGVVTANHDEKWLTFIDLLAPKDRLAGLASAGRLDRDTEGLLFLTTNGQLLYELAQDKKSVPKRYEATVKGRVTSADQAAFAEGIIFADGQVCQPATLEILAVTALKSQVRITISEGKRHQIKKMFLACDKKVLSLRRIAIGPLTLGAIAVGDYRALNRAEILTLKSYFR